MEQSILKSTKKILSVGDDDDSFDLDIITHLNAAFATLHDLGVGGDAGYVVQDENDAWEDFLDPDEQKVLLGHVKTYVYLKVRMFFDPPSTQYLLEATNKQIQEAEWRINAVREASEWVDPLPFEHTIVDGGDPVSPYVDGG